MRLLIVSGVSGSGKSTALNALEDIGYYCLDKLPSDLISRFLELLQFERSERYALLVDCRDFTSVALVREAIPELKKLKIDTEILFLEANEETVKTRFRQTRRPHPMVSGSASTKTIGEALETERRLLADLRSAADFVVDTSNMSPHDLRRELEAHDSHQRVMRVSVESFGFKYSTPNDADLVLDVRFLPNPHYVAELRPQTGKDKAVADYVFSHQDAHEILQRYRELLSFLLPRYRAEGKRYLKIGIGCTGGKHRSVALTEALAKALSEDCPNVVVRHRDITLL
ncbi:UNVERIFIED_CONTAM: hypothetical protein GTU68_061628 [Idotea baltica]|nr:hypothetical protein [Idotea baltica]